ncbi:hypothetical protein [Clavibacter capsici]|uniref:hypothetical protein n=1 Tax=Clavibacter capsici TaxID=1874630 RepID=UPI00142832FC|nr:hypothetical protein [Clavibacter capsici]QIS38112.1 hypothetical protein GW572_01185 [Clavibacter capsici]
MPSIAPSTRSSRRLRRAGTVAAAAAIALSATFGLGIAPASAATAAAAPASTPTDASQITIPGAKPGPAPKWPGAQYRFVFQTHWVKVADGGQNIRSFRIRGYSVRPGGLAVNDINECVTYPGYDPKITDYRNVGIVLPQILNTTVTSYSGPSCTGYDYSKVGGSGPIDRGISTGRSSRTTRRLLADRTIRMHRRPTSPPRRRRPSSVSATRRRGAVGPSTSSASRGGARARRRGSCAHAHPRCVDAESPHHPPGVDAPVRGIGGLLSL